MKKGEMEYTIYLNTSVFRLPKGKAICVRRYSEFNNGISFKMSFPDSYGKGKEIEFFVPWHNVDYIESND